MITFLELVERALVDNSSLYNLFFILATYAFSNNKTHNNTNPPKNCSIYQREPKDVFENGLRYPIMANSPRFI